MTNINAVSELPFPSSNTIGTAATSNQRDLSSLRLTQDFGAIGGVKKVITTVPCRKPSNQAYVRVRPGDKWRMSAAILQLKDDGECYLVVPELFNDLAQEVRPKVLYTGVTRDGNPFLWPINMPGEDGRIDSWSESAHTAAALAEDNWVRLIANRTIGAYDVMQATNLADDPTWPELSFEEMVNLAFRGKLIDSLDHPVVRRLRGEL